MAPKPRAPKVLKATRPPRPERPRAPPRPTQKPNNRWAWLLLVLLLLGLFLGLWFFVFHWGGWGETPCGTGCCTTLSFSVDADFGVDDGSGMDETFEVTAVDLLLVHMSENIYNLIMDQGLTSEGELLAYLDAHYPDEAYLIYVQTSELLIADGRALVDYDFANRSIEGTTTRVCEPGVMIVPYMDFTVCYANGTYYGEYDSLIVEDLDVFSDLVNGTANIPPAFVTQCGSTYAIELVSLDLAPPGGVDPEVTVIINGVEYAFPVS